VSPTWPPEQGPVVAALILASAAFVAFHYFANAGSWARRSGTDAGAPANWFRQRIGGFVLLGVIPAAMTPLLGWRLDGTGLLALPAPGRTLLLAVCICAVTLPAIAISSRAPDFPLNYPQIRVASWDRSLRLKNGLTWALYLVGYEYFFRGFLLFGLADAFGAWPAVAMTTFAYVLAHIHKNADETIGCIPMGVVFAWGTLWSGSIWGAWLAHVVIANTSELLATRRAVTPGV
jgi:uncharacterized protein